MSSSYENIVARFNALKQIVEGSNATQKDVENFEKCKREMFSAAEELLSESLSRDEESSSVV